MATVRLTDLNPRWANAGGEGVRVAATGEPVPLREGVAVTFDCPCGCDQRCAIFFDPPLDGKGLYMQDGRNVWQREGDSFDNLTLTPSIQRVGGCAWHGWIRNGEVIKC